MHYDHLDGNHKRFQIGSAHQRYGRKSIQAEINKCDLICANCHAIRTYMRKYNNLEI
jgi:hypothetical protein